MSFPNPSEPLARALSDWRVASHRNPQFRAEVWQRIEAARRTPTWTNYLRAHGALVASALMIAIMLGAWGGRERARARDAAARDALVAEYVHGLDARWMRLP